MSITATTKTNSKKFEPIEAGSYPARCYSMIEMGTNEENYQGTAKMVNKVRITWELPTEMQVCQRGAWTRAACYLKRVFAIYARKSKPTWLS